MAIEPYRRAVAVQDMPGSRTALPEVQDVGPAFQGLGRSLLQTAEPYLRDKAEREAIEAAGVADIAKDEQGNYIRPPAKPGGGLVYNQIYDRAMDERYAGVVVKEAENTFNRMSAEHRNDPEALLAAMQGHAEGVLKAVDPRVRAQVEINLSREVSERFRGVTQLKAARDEQATVNGLQLEYRTRTEKAVEILRLGGPDAVARADVEFAGARKAVTDLQKLGEISPTGAGAMIRSAEGDYAEAGRVNTSQGNLRALGPTIKDLDDTELQRLSYWGLGIDDGGKVGNMDFAGFGTAFPDKTTAQLVGRVSSNVLGDRIAERNAAAAAAAAAQQQQTAQAILTAIKDDNFNPALGYSKEQVAAIEQGYSSTGSAHDQMQTPQGRQNTLAYLANYGLMPQGVVDYVEGQIMGNQVGNISEFMQNVQMVRSKGVWVGQRLYEQLSPQARATLEFDETMRRAGIPDSVRAARLEEARRGDLPTRDEVVAAYRPTRQGAPDYSAQRTAAIASALGLTPQQAQAAVLPGRDFDALLRVNFKLYAGDPAKAMQMTARSIAAGWIKNDAFVGGVGPKDLATAGFTIKELSDALLSDRSKNPTGARIEGGPGGYARLRPISDNPTPGFGIYEVQLFTPNGRPTGSFPVDMDVALRGAIRSAGQRRQQESAARMRAAFDAMPRFVVGTDPRDGKVGYIPKQILPTAPADVREAFLRANPAWRGRK